ncbi:MAG: hypothetical protein AAGJ32_12700 [Pseudomonadota bacterium]
MIEKLLRRRTSILWFALIGFSLWQGGIVVAELHPQLDRGSNFVQALGTIVFGLAMLRLTQLSYAIKKTSVESVLNDELTQLMRFKAFYFAYYVLGGTVGVLVGLSPFVEFQPAFILRILLVTTVVVPLASFLWLDHKAGAQA